MEDDLVIKVEGLSKSFGAKRVLNNITLNVKKGRSLIILGGSGTGKSVLIKTIIGLISPDKGIVKINNHNIHSVNGTLKKKLISKCGFLFQNGALFDSLTVQENIMFFAEKLSKLTSADKQNIAKEKLVSVGLSENILNYYPVELSGGMQKRVALARAVCTNPEIIFFDEPTTGLDPIMSNVINNLIIKAKKKLGATTVTITHDINSAKQIADDVALIDQGSIVWQGVKEDLENPTNPYLYQFLNGLGEGPISVS